MEDLKKINHRRKLPIDKPNGLVYNGLMTLNNLPNKIYMKDENGYTVLVPDHKKILMKLFDEFQQTLVDIRKTNFKSLMGELPF